MTQSIDFEGVTHEFPDDFSRQDIQKALATAHPAKPAPQAEESPRWDVLGDTGRQAEGAFNGGADATKKSIGQLGAGTREQRYQENVAKNGPVLGTLKDAFVDTPAEIGNALKIPFAGMGVLASPLTGLLHGTLGSAISYLPGMDKKEADSVIDRASMFLAPATMRFGLNAPGRLSQQIVGAPQAAQANVDASNAAAKAANPAFAQAREAGYVVHPADSGGESIVGDLASQVGGKIKTQQAASVHNQAVTNSIAAKELGLPADATLDDAAFNGVRGGAANAYKVIENSASSLPNGRIVADNDFLTAVSGLDAKSAEFVADFPEAAAKRSSAVQDIQDSVLKSSFSPKAGIEMIRGLREDARANLKNAMDPDKMRIGFAQRDAANAMEDLIERNLTAAGNTDAVANYRSARQMIAKSHDVEAATDAAGNVDARKLAALGQRRPLSGGLKTIADTASAFPKSTQVPSKFGGLEKRSILDTLWSLGTGATGVATGHAALGVSTAALPFIRPLARNLALSERVQNGLLGLRQQPGNFMPMVREGALPAAAGATNLNELQREILRLFSKSPPQQQQQ